MQNEGRRASKGTDLRARTKAFALRIIQLTDILPRTRVADVMGRQLLRCGTSVGANYRSACRAKSKADFAAKMAIVLEEADECVYWIELLIGSGLCKTDAVAELAAEANALVSIAVSSIKTAKSIASS
ncbi:MAG: four helix bundle protein [Armatimonadetes bacterium]|nr:four helix bundle protein [Armatimonadota bacterium]